MTAPEISALLDYNDRRVAASIKVIGEVGHRDALDFLHLVIRSNGTGGDFDAKETVSAAIGAVRAIYAMEIKDARNLLETETALRALINAPAVTPENKALATELLGIIGTTEKRTQGAAAAKEVVGEHTEKAAGKGGRKLGFGIGGY